jgi:biofilm PGA synthesis protein PgaD
MEKSRSRTRSRRPLIIERPDLQSPSQRVASTVLTLVFWVIWVYLWLPLIGLVGWLFGADRFYHEMIRLDGFRGIVDLAALFGVVVTAIVGALFAWALYNLARFRGRERRNAAAPLTLGQLGVAAGVAPGTLSIWQHARLLRVEHDEDGRILHVAPSPGTPVPEGPGFPGVPGGPGVPEAPAVTPLAADRARNSEAGRATALP